MPDLKLHPDESPENPLARIGFFDELNSPNTPAYTLPRVAGTSGQVITIDANGDCNFQSVGSIGSLGSIEFRALPYYDNVNAAASDWSPSGKTITPEVYFNLSQVSYNAVKTNNTWRYEDPTNLTFTGGDEDTGVSKPALGFATHTDGVKNPNVTGNFIYTDAVGTEHTFSFRIDWLLIQEGAAGSDGSAGTSSRSVTLTASDQSIEYNKDGTTPDPETVTVFAEAINASDTHDVFFEFFVDDVSQGITQAGDNSPHSAQITLTSDSTIGSPKKVEVQIREELDSPISENPILARDQIVIFPLKQGSDGITIILSNEAHTLPTTSSGTITFTGSGTDIEVYEGTTQLSYDDSAPFANSSFRVTATPTNVTLDTPTTVGNIRRFGAHTAMSADNASVEFSITVKSDEGVERTFTKKQSLAKSKQGAEGSAGSAGRTVTLSAGDQIFEYATNGADPQGKNSGDNQTVITATARNTTGTLYYEFFEDDTSVQSSTSNTYTYTSEADIANMPDKIEVELREGGDSPPNVVARDQFTIFGVQQGTDAVTIAIDNEAHTVSTNSAGDSPDIYVGSGTNIDVFEGATHLTYDDSAPFDNGTYRISATPSGITIGSASTSSGLDTPPDGGTSGKTRIFGDHSSMTGADAKIVYSITVKRADSTEQTFTRTQSISKSADGEDGVDGSDAKTVRLTAADYVIEYDQSGKNPNVSGDSPSEEIVLTATAQNFTDPYFKFTGNGITEETSYTNGTSGDDADTFTFSVPADYSSTPKVIRVGVAEAAAATTEITFDSTTIASVKEGSGNVAAFLTNDSHVFPASSSGAVSSYLGSGTRIEVYEGATELDYDGSGTTAGHFTVSTSGTNITPGSVSEYDSPPDNSPEGYKALVDDHSAVVDGINTSTIVYTIAGKRGNGEAFSITKNQTFSKSKTGTPGTDGTDAAAIKLIADSHVIPYAKAGDESPETVVGFTTEIQSITNPYYEFYVNKHDGSGDVKKRDSLTTSTFTLADADEPAVGKSVTVKVKVYEGDSPSVEDPVAIDSVSIYAVQDGSDAVTGFLTNTAHVAVANSSGTVSSFDGAGGTYKVFVGSTEVTSSAGCTFSVSTETGVDVSIDASSGVYSVASMSADQGTATFQAVISAGTGGSTGATLTSDYSISKSIEGASTFSSFPHSTGAAQVGGSGLTFILNSTDGVPNSNAGEVYIKGTTFIDAAGTGRTGLTETYVATPYGEGSSGIFFLMYTNTAANTRFGGSENSPEANGLTHQNIVGIRSNGSNGYVLVDNLLQDNVDDSPHANNTIDFESTDCIVAAVEASSTTGGITRIQSFLQGADGATGGSGAAGDDGARKVNSILFWSAATIVGTATASTTDELKDTTQTLSTYHDTITGTYEVANTSGSNPTTFYAVTGSPSGSRLSITDLDFTAGDGYIIRPKPDIGTAAVYDFTNDSFDNLDARWSLTRPEVQVNKSYERYWEVAFSAVETLTSGSGDGEGPITFGTPVPSIRFGVNIESDTFSTGVSGWQIQRDSGDAEFNNVTARGSIKGGKGGPTDYIGSGASLNTGFYVGPDGASSYDFIIGDSTNQLRFDGSSGDLDIQGADFTVGSNEEKVTISSNEIFFGKGTSANSNLKIDYDSTNNNHRIVVANTTLSSSSIPTNADLSLIEPEQIFQQDFISASSYNFGQLKGGILKTWNYVSGSLAYYTYGHTGFKHYTSGGSELWTLADSTVGTTNAKFSGGLQIMGPIIDSTGDDGDSGDVPTADGSGGWAWAAQTGSGGGGVSGSGTIGTMPIWTGSTTALGNSNISFNSDNMTVSASDSSAMLHTLENTDTSASSNITLRLSAGTTDVDLITTRNNSSTTNGHFELKGAANAAAGAFYSFDSHTIRSSGGSTYATFDSAGDFAVDTDTLFVDASADRVGIGTTTPGAELDVDGAIYARGGSYAAGTDTETAALVIDEGDYIYTKDGGYLRKLIGKAYSSDTIEIGHSNTSLIDQINLIPGNAGDDAVKINGNTVWNAGNTNIQPAAAGTTNVALGFNALDSETSAGGLTAIGHNALTGNNSAGHATQGTLNTGVGYGVLKDSAIGYYNTGIGYEALLSVDAGHSNVGVGVMALRFDSSGTTSGYQNIGVGFQTGYSLTTGYQNVMVGHMAGYSMTSAYENVAIGYDSGGDITDGLRNVTIGTQAGRVLTTGDYNTLIGRAAGYDQTTASHNTAVGASAGENMTSGGNVFVGSQSGINATSGVNTAVGYQTLEQCTTGSLNTAIGYRAMDTLTTASNHTAVGSYAGLGSDPSSDAGNVWVGYDAGNGPVGTCTGVGNVGIGHQCMTSHTTATGVLCVGYQSGLYLQTANDSVGIGRNTLQGESSRLVTGSSNVAVGAYAQQYAYTGAGNTSMGRLALRGVSGTGVTGSYNVALGYESGIDITSGGYNVMSGYRAGYNISSGGTNTAIGTEVMLTATSAAGNVAVGRQALYSLTDGLYNVALGRDSLDSTTTGDYNVAVGYQALDDNVTGSSKTAVGYQALQNDTGASLSTAVGSHALGGQTTGLYNVAIGYSAGGSVATNSDNVFIGTTTGIATTGASNTMVGFQAGYDQTSGSNNLLLGKFAGRSSSPSNTITTGSNRIVLGDNSITNADIKVSWNVTSDRRDKADIEDLSFGLDFVNKLRPVTYRWDQRSDYFTSDNEDLKTIVPDGTHKKDKLNVGLIAQEVAEIEKEFGYSTDKNNRLFVDKDEENTKMSMSYERLVPVLVNAIKELSAEIEKLKSQLNQS